MGLIRKTKFLVVIGRFDFRASFDLSMTFPQLAKSGACSFKVKEMVKRDKAKILSRSSIESKPSAVLAGVKPTALMAFVKLRESNLPLFGSCGSQTYRSFAQMEVKPTIAGVKPT
jgi:hypothetical protein